jgi:ERCC4-type nuclease
VLDPQTRIERKTVADLHASVTSGKLWGQVNRLRSVSVFPVLVVEGPDLDAGPLPPDSVRGVLVALADRGVTIIRSTDPRDSARWIPSLASARAPNKRIQIHVPFRGPFTHRFQRNPLQRDPPRAT